MNVYHITYLLRSNAKYRANIVATDESNALSYLSNKVSVKKIISIRDIASVHAVTPEVQS